MVKFTCKMVLRFSFKNVLSMVICLLCVSSVGTQNTTITIPLNKTISPLNKELYNTFIMINCTSTIRVNFNNINNKVSYIIFQVHSHLYNITLYNNTYVRDSCITGTNVGLYSSVKPALDTFYIYNPNQDNDLTLYISVHGYKYKDPIPGGCNMEFPVPISPFLQISYNKEYIFVEAGAPQYNSDVNCNQIDKVFVNFYMMYMPEGNYDADTYFKSIKNMMTYEEIINNAVIISKTSELWNMRRMLSAYPGTGAVYVAVAYTNDDSYSVYVPTYTYACSPLEFEGCKSLDDMLSQILCASLLFFGLFVCYFGHRFFKTEMVLIGFITGVLITYIVISLITEIDRPALLAASVFSGICSGAIWLLYWYFYGIPVFAVLLATLNFGYLVSALMYYAIPGIAIMEHDINFWTVYILIMFLTSLLLLSVTKLGNILCCAVLGAYAALFPIDYYIGSNLKYIVINTVRRATVPLFNKALIAPPFQSKDFLLTFLWVLLATTGFFYQYYYTMGRAPFPPPDRCITLRPDASTNYGATGNKNIRSQRTATATRSNYPDARTPLLA